MIPKIEYDPAGFLEKRLTTSYSNVPAWEALKVAALEAGARIYADDTRVIIYPNTGTLDEQIRKEFRVRVIPDAKAEPIDYREELASNGMIFYEGGEALYYQKEGRLVVTNTQEQLDLLLMAVEND